MGNVQYQDLISSISRKLNWDLQTNIIAVTGKLENEDNPLFPIEQEEDKVFRLKDALALQEQCK